MDPDLFDLLILGGGITGTAEFFVSAKYTNMKRIGLIEKYDGVGQVASHPENNSQTLHFGDIETNYTLDKALRVKDAASLMLNYVLDNPAPGLYNLTNKMVLAVGADEVAEMRERFEIFKEHFPALRLVEADELAQVEPAVMIGRDTKQPVVALVSSDGYAINYQLLSESFLQSALDSGKEIRTFFDTKVKAITRQEDGTFVIDTGDQQLHTKSVLVAAGPYSMLFAQAMGYVPELAFLPVAGSFYFADRHFLNGKVYTVQIPELPFAAVHGDPDVAVPGQTRFGPTAKAVPLLERHRYNTFWPYVRTPVRRLAGILTVIGILRTLVIAKFIIKNFLFDWPLIGKWLFLRQVRKVIPTLRWGDIKLGKGLGGLRPQIIDIKSRAMQLGESTIVEDRIIFNTTPSPGATVALKNAENDVRTIIEHLGEGYEFDQAAFNHDLRPTSTEEGFRA